MRIKSILVLATCLLLVVCLPVSGVMAEDGETPVLELHDFCFCHASYSNNQSWDDFNVEVKPRYSEYITHVAYTDDYNNEVELKIPYTSNDEETKVIDLSGYNGRLTVWLCYFEHLDPQVDRQYTLWVTSLDGTLCSNTVSYMQGYRDDFRPFMQMIYNQGELFIYPGGLSYDMPTDLYRIKEGEKPRLLAQGTQQIGNNFGYIDTDVTPGCTYTYYLVNHIKPGWDEESDYYTFTIPNEAGVR